MARAAAIEETPAKSAAASGTVFPILFGISFCHLLNDMIQSLLPAIYPILKSSYHLAFLEVGLITFVFQMTASVLQPLVGMYTDRRPQPFSLAFGMGFTLLGLLTLSQAGSLPMILLGAALVGTGSSVFHPESSRVARMASGGRLGLAQSVFQVGGNAGQAIGPLLAAFVVAPHGQGSVAWFSAAALLGIVLLTVVGRWYAGHYLRRSSTASASGAERGQLSPEKTRKTLAILVALVFSKHFYLSSIGSYFTFYLIERFHVSVQNAQVHLFVFMGSVAAGTILGGPLGDRFGRKHVIWGSILGVLPFTLALPHVSLAWTGILTVPIGLILASAFPAIIVYAQELVPKKVGMIAGLFFGLAFGVGGIGAAALGVLADHLGIEFVYHVCAFLPAIGLLAGFLPQLESGRRRKEGAG